LQKVPKRFESLYDKKRKTSWCREGKGGGEQLDPEGRTESRGKSIKWENSRHFEGRLFAGTEGFLNQGGGSQIVPKLLILQKTKARRKKKGGL